MLVYKSFVVFLYLCLVQKSIGIPISGNEVAEGRGVLSSVWGWITYPFSWWHSGESEQPEQPGTEHLLGSKTTDPNDIVDIRSHNVTIWCNDQTCTTMKCDNIQCKNSTCNIYETDFRGECREYNIVTDLEQDTVQKPSETVPNNYVTNSPIHPAVEDHPLELEAVLSSTINKQTKVEHSDSKEASIMHEIKV